MMEVCGTGHLEMILGENMPNGIQGKLVLVDICPCSKTKRLLCIPCCDFFFHKIEVPPVER